MGDRQKRLGGHGETSLRNIEVKLLKQPDFSDQKR